MAGLIGLVSGISGFFPRRLFVGTLLPVVVFVVVAAALVEPLVPERWGSEAQWGILGAGWQLELATLVTVLLTGLLYVLNVPLIQLYEGYPWRESWIGRALTARQQERLRRVAVRERFLGKLVRAFISRKRSNSLLGALRQERDKATRSRLNEFPKLVSVLPTRLGNAIRARENYPERQYDMAGNDLWPRLALVLPGDLATSLDSAKARFDFMLNASFLSKALAAIGLSVAILAPQRPGYRASWSLAAALGGIILALALYRGSIGQAEAWGEMVKAAFDLHRIDLLRALGVSDEPTSLIEERVLWREISLQLAFTDPWDGTPPLLRYRAPLSPARPEGRAAKGSQELELTRGVEEVDARRLRVILRLRHLGAEAATGVEVVDFLHPGWDYEWGTAKIDRGTVEITGIDPLRFAVGPLHGGEVVEISYQTIRRGWNRP